MKRSLMLAALVALGLTVFAPVDSSATDTNRRHRYINGTNGNNGGVYCPPKNGNNHAVPEPGTMALLSAAAMGAMYIRKRVSKQ